MMRQHHHYVPITASMNFAFGLILGLITGDIVAMFLLAGVLRMVINHHAAFSLNSMGHHWGKRKFRAILRPWTTLLSMLLLLPRAITTPITPFPRKGLSWLGSTWQYG
ncbi:hypothetical protein [Microbulbifer sp. PSTR4-B]|uniref:hypothetical protein n=1 Tax=Microbulbifer sp. PSTR4-B TaxID=3243396 RepID=UPI004039419A